MYPGMDGQLGNTLAHDQKQRCGKEGRDSERSQEWIAGSSEIGVAQGNTSGERLEGRQGITEDDGQEQSSAERTGGSVVR